MITPTDRLIASEQVMEALKYALGEIESVNWYGDPVIHQLHWDLEGLYDKYERHHKMLDDEARYYEDEIAGVTYITEAM